MPDPVRTMLVEMVDAAPPLRTIRRGRFAIAAIAAFALAGAATGGAISATALVTQDSPVSDSDISFSADQLRSIIVAEHAKTFGPQFAIGAASTTVVDLGPRPAGAESLALGIHCLEAGSFDEYIDGVWTGSLTCSGEDADSSHGGGGGLHSVIGDGSHTLRIDSPDGSRYVVWAAWATEAPIPAQSSEQVAALADGTVSRDEYLAGFDRFAACMADAGYPISVGVSREATVLNYATPGAANDDGTDARCYVAEFEQLDESWQLANEDTSYSTELLRDCLRAAGIEPAVKTEEVVAQLEAAGIDLITCV